LPEKPNMEQDRSQASRTPVLPDRDGDSDGNVVLALWDEAWTQRPWKAFQEQWKARYGAFLNTARSKSIHRKRMSRRILITLHSSWLRKDLSGFESPAAEARKAVDEVSARLLAVQSCSPTGAPISTHQL